MTDKSQSTEVKALIDAMDQILDDMGSTGLCVCLLAKAKARIAFEPFIPPGDTEYFLSLEEATRIVKEGEDAR
jgi:hypothetical protein